VFIGSTGMTRINEFQKYIPIDNAIAQAYEDCTGPGPEGPTKNQFFFGQGWHNSRWNRHVLENLIVEVVNQQAVFRIPGECIPSEVIRICLQDHLKQAHASWQLDKPRICASGDRFESAAEAQSRARAQERNRSVKLKVHQRKFKKYNERLETLDALLSSPHLSITDRAKWKLAKQVLLMLRTEGQSSEHTESDENESLVTYVPFYRRRIVGQILCEVDQETAALKLRTTQSKGKQ
ncbi:hypothetical protein BT96DRAFT_789349, partial [Gymnopus androsaceus JB14]